MKKELKLVEKLIDFLIRTISRLIKAGTKTMNAVEKIAIKTGVLGDALIDLNNLLIQLQEIKLKLKNVSGDK